MQQKNNDGVAAAITTRRSRAVKVANTHEDDGKVFHSAPMPFAWLGI
jgi:hypothetical protein